MIDIRGLTKRFGSKTAVDDLTLHIAKGELFAFLGPNGAGKTTTIKILTGLLKPTTGEVSISGLDVSRDYLEVKSRISYIPEQPYLYDKLTGREFLNFVGQLQGMAHDRLAERIAHFGDIFEYNEYIDELCESYSHGMKQKVVITAAFMHEPEVIVIDEPMVGLDPKSARLVKDLFRNTINRGCTILMSTHTLAVAEQVADRIGIIMNGRLLASGTLEELRSQSGKSADLESIFLKITEGEAT